MYESINDHSSGNLCNINRIFKLFLIEKNAGQNGKYINASILRAISERINDEDCVTEETRLDFSPKSGGTDLISLCACSN